MVDRIPSEATQYKFPDTRLRDAFAQLLLQGNSQAVPMDAVWAAQGRHQFPPPPPTDNMTERPEVPGDQTTRTPMPLATDRRQQLGFPTAPAGPMSPDRALTTMNSDDRQRPFPNAQDIEVVGPYHLPKSPEKTGKRRK
jgi:hypothetical protein